MKDRLGASELRQLANIKQKLVLQSSVQVPCAKKIPKWLANTLLWCDQRHLTIGRPLAKAYHLDAQDLAAIEQSLAADGLASIEVLVASLDGDRKLAKTSDEKLARQTPMHQRVLVACTDANVCSAIQTLYRLAQAPQQTNHEIAISELDLTAYQYLLVVENRDSFNDWHLFQPCANTLEDPLVVYRGHEQHHSKACQQLLSLWQQQKGDVGLVYFGDADIAGLAIATDSPIAYQHLLLPTLAVIEANLNPNQSNFAHDYKLKHLASRLPTPWLGLYQLLHLQGSMRQQNMFNYPLVLY